MAVPTGTAQVLVDPERPSLVTLLVNGVPSSALDLDDPAWLDFEYMQQMALLVAAWAPDGAPVRAVHLGAGGCALARAVDARHPGSRQVAVELDGALPELARRWFALPRAPRLRIRTGDARAELGALPDASADVVVRDVFAGDRTPAHLCTRELVADVARVLRPGGVYLVNCADRAPLPLARSELATLRTVFAHVAAVAEPGLLRGRGHGNVVLVASDDPAPLLRPELARGIRSLPAPARLLTGEEVHHFVGTAPPLVDPARPTAPGPAPTRPSSPGCPAAAGPVDPADADGPHP